ncbi:MAG TPA: PA14 domain-containing protein [Tepidisphaeraceae bacterium]|nr:PA14 domain-containing protein [Tepidisphaeraceae bacterium]
MGWVDSRASRVLALWAVVLAPAAVGQPAGEKDKPAGGGSIFDFGQDPFDESKVVRPAVREKPREAAAVAKPVTPGVVAPEVRPVPVPVTPVAPTSRLMAVPSAAEIAAAEKLLAELYKADLASKVRATRWGAGRKLADAAGAAKTDGPSKYVLLTRARELFAETGDMPGALEQLDKLVAAFDVDEVAVRAEALLALARTPGLTPPAAHAIASEAVRLVEPACREGDYEAAGKLATSVDAAIARVRDRDPVLSTRANVVVSAFRAEKLAADKVQPALDMVMRKVFVDPAAGAPVGRFLCLVRGDWVRGLPLLAVAPGDEPLAALAKADLAANVAGAPAEVRARAADGWFDAAAKEPQPGKQRMLERALYWYRLGLPAFQGLARAQAEQRVAQLEPAVRRLESGLVCEVFWDPALRHRTRVKIDPTISYKFDVTPPDASVNPNVFGARWSGLLRAPKTGKYTLVVSVDEAVRIWIDGNLVLKGANTKSHRKDVQLTEGYHEFRVHYNSEKDNPRLHVGWSLEGGFAEQLIPATAFFHDPAVVAEPLPGLPSLSPHGAITRVKVRVGGPDTPWFDELPNEPGALLVGFKTTNGVDRNRDIVRSLQALYRLPSGEVVEGRWRGKPAGPVTTTMSREGYAVGELTARGGEYVYGFRATFFKVKPGNTGLEPAQKYEGEWVGGKDGKDVKIGGDGRAVVGICGRNWTVLHRLGLITVK